MFFKGLTMFCWNFTWRKYSRVGRQLICIATVVLGLTTLHAQAADPVSFHGFDDTDLTDQAKAGLQNILGGKLFYGGIPLAKAKERMQQLKQAVPNLSYDPESAEGQFYAFGRLPSPHDRTTGAGKEVSLGRSLFKYDGQAMLTFNCFGCHAGVVNGQVVAGLGNNHVNQSDPGELRTRGDNFGPYGVWEVGASLIDPEQHGLAVSDEETELQKLFRSTPLPPVDPMPWWLMKYKTKDYWYADAGPHDAASFSINFTVPHEQVNELHEDHVATVATALAFARETEAPEYPRSLNPDLVEKGANLFHGRTKPAVTRGFRTCKGCHGSYEKNASHTDLSKPGSWTVDYNNSHIIRNVKTDPSYNTTLQAFQPIVDYFNKLSDYYVAQGKPELATSTSVPSKSGYVAPPLVGVWASAPYFHNGSVPTVEAVLNSKIRPEIWARNVSDTSAYDLDKVGMAWRPVTRAEFEKSKASAAQLPFIAEPAVEHSATYDTTEFGHGKMGHTFGDNLSQEERLAIIEFLKSLSGSDMEPKQQTLVSN